MFLGIVLAIAAGLGTAFMLNSMDPTIRGSSDVVALAGAEPFAHVPVIQSRIEIQRRRMTNFALAAGVTVVLVVLFVAA